MNNSLTAMFCFAGLTMGAAAQTPPASPNSQQPPAFQSGGEEVVLDVVVRDKKGRLVRDMKPGDFTILDCLSVLKLAFRCPGISKVTKSAFAPIL